MKAILISTRPQWVELILNLIKKDEIRKGTAIGKAINKLIAEQGVAPILLYCTKGKWGLYDNRSHITSASDIFFIDRFGYDKPPLLNGKVVAQFNATAEEIVTVNRLDTGKVILYRGHKDGLTNRELMEGSCLTFKEMNDYLQGEKGTAVHINDLKIFDKPKEISEFNTTQRIRYANLGLTEIKPLTRAPQSWCYVKV